MGSRGTSLMTRSESGWGCPVWSQGIDHCENYNVGLVQIVGVGRGEGRGRGIVMEAVMVKVTQPVSKYSSLNCSSRP